MSVPPATPPPRLLQQLCSFADEASNGKLAVASSSLSRSPMHIAEFNRVIGALSQLQVAAQATQNCTAVRISPLAHSHLICCRCFAPSSVASQQRRADVSQQRFADVAAQLHTVSDSNRSTSTAQCLSHMRYVAHVCQQLHHSAVAAFSQCRDATIRALDVPLMEWSDGHVADAGPVPAAVPSATGLASWQQLTRTCERHLEAAVSPSTHCLHASAASAR